MMEKSTIITLKNQNISNREVARITGINRKTVARYWNNYKEQISKLYCAADLRAAQEAIVTPPHYDVSSRKPTKYNDAIDSRIDEILALEEEKDKALGKTHKQKLTCAQIHEILVSEGFDIGCSTVTSAIRAKRQKAEEAFIRQEYDPGQRLEYDFGEVKLEIAGVLGTYYLAVFGCPASSFRWAYLYTNQKKEVFLDSHVRFFEMCGGIWSEVVYDNMRNVVTRFIGKNDKELNSDLVKMAAYYGYTINVTNCFAGNEKGFVESSVKIVRRECFSRRYKFDDLKTCERYLTSRLTELNKDSGIAEEMKALHLYRPPLELAHITEQVVDKYSFVRVENNYYSVPEYLVGRKLTAKSYVSEIVIFSKQEYICTHPKAEGTGHMTVDIMHYLSTLTRKPGALKNSKALRSEELLKKVFDDSYDKRPREFIEFLIENKQRPLDEIARLAYQAANGKLALDSFASSQMADNVKANTRLQLKELSSAFLKGAERRAS